VSLGQGGSADTRPAAPLADALLDKIVELTCERDSFRLLSQQAIHELHRVLRARDRLRTELWAPGTPSSSPKGGY
jgi:hypothetical protein